MSYQERGTKISVRALTDGANGSSGGVIGIVGIYLPVLGIVTNLVGLFPLSF